MRRVTGLLAVFLVLSWLATPLPGFGATKLAVLAVKGMVCNA